MNMIIGLALFALLIAAAFAIGSLVMGTIFFIVVSIGQLIKKVVGWNAR